MARFIFTDILPLCCVAVNSDYELTETDVQCFLFSSALCRQQRSRVHVPPEGSRGSAAGREGHAAFRLGEHPAGQ